MPPRLPPRGMVGPPKPRRGRNTRASTMRDGRQYAVAVEGTIITFECQRFRHRYKHDFSKGPVHRRLSPNACTMMARWWREYNDNGGKQGCIGVCPECARMKP